MHGIQLLPGLIEVFLLLFFFFLVNFVLVCDTHLGLQNQLDVLSSACKDRFLGINIDKIKIMVFSKGGFGAVTKIGISRVRILKLSMDTLI